MSFSKLRACFSSLVLLVILLVSFPQKFASADTGIRWSQLEIQATGDLDVTFGSAGKVTNNSLAPLSMIVQSDGRIVVGGTSATAGLARYNSDGSLDTSFGSSGHSSPVLSDIFAVGIQPDGKLVVAGSTGFGPGANFAIARYNQNGTVDSSFGIAGQVNTDFFGFEDIATAIVIQQDGRIIAGGRARTGTIAGGFGLARYNSDGSLDTTFGSAGKVTTNFSNTEFSAVRTLAIQTDGRIVAAGTQNLGHTDMIAARYMPDGNLDASFGSGGKLSIDFSQTDIVGGMAIQPDNRIVLAGAMLTGTNNFNFALARVNQDGSLDPTFGVGGKVVSDFCGNTDVIRSVALQSDGHILVAGSCNSVTADFLLARYDMDGVLDTSFGSGGTVTTDFFNNFDVVIGAAIQPGGRLLVAGQVRLDGTTTVGGIAGYSLGADFGIGFAQTAISGQRGDTIKIPVAVIRSAGFSGAVTITPPDTSSLNIKVKPNGPKATTGSSSSFKLKVKGSAVIGSHDLTFTGADSSGRRRSATITVTIQQ